MINEIKELIVKKVDEKGKWVGLIKGVKVRVVKQHGKYFASPSTSNCGTELETYLKMI